jgi:hypothetical protein
MKITASSDIGNIETFEDLKRYVQPFLDQTKTVINGGVAIENLKTTLVTVNVQTANIDIQIGHKLGSIPLGYLKIQGSNVSVYDNGKNTWTTENIFLRFSGTGEFTILVMG